MKKETRGGKRANAGRKSIYGEKTKAVSFKCPISKIPEIKQDVKIILSKLVLPTKEHIEQCNEEDYAQESNTTDVC